MPLLDAGALCHTRASGSSSSSCRNSGRPGAQDHSNHRSNHKDSSADQSSQNEAFVSDPNTAAAAAAAAPAHCRGDNAAQIGSTAVRSPEYLAKMRQRGMVPSLDECNAAMRTWSERDSSAAKVVQMLADMLRNGPEPDLVSFQITLDACERRRMADWAVYALSQAVRQGMRPAVDPYNKALRACRRGQWGTAQWLVAQMRKQGLQPDGLSFRTVVRAAQADNQAGILDGTISEMQDAGMELQPNVYVSGVKAWAANTCWSRALELMSKCRSSGLQPMGYATYLGGRACAKGSQWERAQHFFDASAQHGLDRHLQAVEVMAIASRMAGLWERAASLLQELQLSAGRSQ